MAKRKLTGHRGASIRGSEILAKLRRDQKKLADSSALAAEYIHEFIVWVKDATSRAKKRKGGL